MNGIEASPAVQHVSGHVAFLLSHDEPGGARNLWEQVADGLQARHVDVSLNCVYGKDLSGQTAWTAIQTKVLALTGFARAVVATARRLRYLGCDTVLSAQPAANIIGALAGWRAGISCRLSSHHTPLNTYNPLLRWLDMLVGCSPAVHRVICVSEGVRLSTLRYPQMYQRKVVVIRNALAPASAGQIAALHRVRRALPSDRAVRIVAAGRLAEQKNYPVLIRAMAHVPSAELHILGDGPDRPALEALITELGLDGRVLLLGHRAHSDALVHMASCDVFAQPSLFEGHSVALLEAAALGLPLVVSDAPTQVEALRNSRGLLCGAVVPVHDSVALGQALNHLCTHEAAFGHAAELADLLASESSFDRLVDQYLSVRSDVRGTGQPKHQSLRGYAP